MTVFYINVQGSDALKQYGGLWNTIAKLGDRDVNAFYCVWNNKRRIDESQFFPLSASFSGF